MTGDVVCDNVLFKIRKNKPLIVSIFHKISITLFIEVIYFQIEKSAIFHWASLITDFWF